MLRESAKKLFWQIMIIYIRGEYDEKEYAYTVHNDFLL